MSGVNELVRPGTIARTRMFLGGVLLFAAVLTWGIGMTLDPHGNAVVAGIEHVRSTVVTFKRNGAIGTLILCVTAAGLLFPKWRNRQPLRDWALIAILALLAGSSVYTLLTLSASEPVQFDENLATSNSDLNTTGMAADASLPGANMAPTPGLVDLPIRNGGPSAAKQPVEQPAPRDRIHASDTGSVTDPAVKASEIGSSDPADPTNSSIDENRD